MIFPKFTPTRNSETIMLKDVGKISPNSMMHIRGPLFSWPKAITAGDISRNGQQILIRNYQGKQNISI